MQILVIGSGGREHAVIKALKKSPKVDALYCCPGNGGIAADATCIPIKATDIEGVVAFAKEKAIDLVFVPPDDPLVLGMVDALEEAGIRAFGPRKNAAILEGSKVFSKNLMKKYGIPTAAYETFDDPQKAIAYIENFNRYPIVIKADGLALGKGVLIAGSFGEAKEAVKSIMEDKAFGQSGNHIVVEEFLEGVEVSVLAFTDSKTVCPMPSSMDHKRAFDGDQGLNTGGMGTICPNPLYTPAIAQRCQKEIFEPTIAAMAKEGRPFRGVLYFGLMLTEKGPYVIEYNCRFGDPETQVILPLLKTDLVEIIEAVEKGALSQLDIQWEDAAAACVILASGGYPQSYEKGLPISGLDAHGQADGVTIYHAGTALADGGYKTAGGRVLGVTAVAPTLREALDAAYAAAGKIDFPKKQFRTDIGAKALS